MIHARCSSSNNQMTNQQKLLVTFKERRYYEFNELIKLRDIQVDYFYGEPDNGTLLDLVCRSEGNGGYASILILNGASIWRTNEVTGKCALDEAIANFDDNTLQQLGAALKQQMFTSGDDLAHKFMRTAVQKNNVEMIKLVTYNLPQTTVYNPKGPHMELLQGSVEAVRVFMECFDIDMEFQTDSYGCDRSCREIILEKYPQLELELPVVSTNHLRNVLCSYLHRGLTELFLNRLSKIDTNTLNESFRGSHDKTYLHLACEYNQINVVYAILKRNVFLNKLAREPGAPKKASTPIMLAAFGGYYKITEELLRIRQVRLQIQGIGSVLHSVIRGMSTSQQPSPDSNHGSILKSLLDASFLAANTSTGKLDIDFTDNDNRTALYNAIAFNNEFAIGSLIDAGANLYLKDAEGQTILSSIPAKILERCFDDCIQYVCPKENESHGLKFDIRLNYNIFVRRPHQTATRTNNYEMQFWDTIEQESELKILFKHPLSESFLYAKWCLFKRYYCVNLIFYLSFCFFLSAYIFKIEECQMPSARSNVSRSTDGGKNVRNNSILCHASYLPLMSLYVVLVVKEVCKFFVSIRSYSWIENWLKMTMIVAIGVFFADQTNAQLAATVILMSWIEFVFFLGRLPLLSIYIEMFKTVASNFAKFFILYSILVASFACSFFILFHDQVNKHNWPQNQTKFNATNNHRNNDENSINSWRDPTVSFIKSIIMMIGEFDASSLPLGSNFNYSYAFFTFFIFLVTIVLHNLLEGLAVSDTRAIMENAEVVALISQARQISQLERLFLSNPFQYFRSRLPKFFDCEKIRQFERGYLFLRGKIFGSNVSLCGRTRMDKARIGKDMMVFVRPSKNNKITTSFASDKYIGKLPSAIVKQAKRILEERNQSKSINNVDQNTVLRKDLSKYECVDELVRRLSRQIRDLERKIDLNRADRDEKLLRSVGEINKRLEHVEQKLATSISEGRRSKVRNDKFQRWVSM